VPRAPRPGPRLLLLSEGEGDPQQRGLARPGLDVRGEGGYVVMPPSRTRGLYRWVDTSALAEATWLIERLAEGEEATLF
jgi:hypothetical protein